jgi:NifB/MoaA-like Fe-S oxidoreductase
LSNNKKGGIPWWAKVALAGTAIVAGGVALYELAVKTFAAGPQAAQQQLSYWSGEYSKELNNILVTNTLPTAAEEYALQAKQTQMDTAYNELFSIWGMAENVLIDAIAAAATVWLISTLARGYWNTHVGQVKTPAGAIQLLRSAEAIDLYATGHTSLALAFQDQTEAVFTSLYTPTFETEITDLQAQTEVLTGTELELTEALVETLQVEVATTIPSLFAAAEALMPPV